MRTRNSAILCFAVSLSLIAGGAAQGTAQGNLNVQNLKAKSPASTGAAPVLSDLEAGTYTVTLITGDRVTLDVAAGGPASVSVEQAPRADGSIPDITIPTTGDDGLITGTVTLADGGHGIPGVAEPGQGVPGVTITVQDTPLSATTDSDGRFHFPRVPAGSYTLIASSPIFPDSTAQLVTVDAVAGAIADFTFDAPALIPVTGRGLEAPLGVVDVGNLDARLFVAGHARWDHDGDGIIFNETHGGQLWTPLAGMRMFEISDALYWTPSIYTPRAIADNETVAGTTNFRVAFTTAPWRWTPHSGLEFLPMPDEPTWTGTATAISRNGQAIAGTMCHFPLRPRPCVGAAGAESRAVIWEDGLPTELPTDEPFAEARALDDSGTVAVGATGPAAATVHATRWVDGVEELLQPVGTSSVALFSSADGSVAAGTAVMDDGAVALVRWGPLGDAEVIDPPADMSLVELHAFSADGSTAVGSVADGLGDPQFRDWAPFVWSERDGFTVLPEAEPLAEYDRSRAVDVSDDGRVVIGEFDQSVRGPGDPPNLAFVWRGGPRAVPVNELLQEAGVEDPDFWDAITISRDGSWLLTGGTGHPDSSVLIARLNRCADGFSEDENVTFGDEDSGVPNYARSDGCTFLDLVWVEAPFDTHGQLVLVVRSLTAEWLRDGLLTKHEAHAIVAAAARSEIGRGGQQ